MEHHAVDSYIILKDIRLYAYHGVYEQERQTGDYYTVNLRLKFDFTAALTSDDIADTANYAEAYDIIREEMKSPSLLIEHVAGRICRRLEEHFAGAEEIRLSILKENPPMGAECGGAGIEITKSLKKS